jgi:hypothetical protein
VQGVCVATSFVVCLGGCVVSSRGDDSLTMELHLVFSLVSTV